MEGASDADHGAPPYNYSGPGQKHRNHKGSLFKPIGASRATKWGGLVLKFALQLAAACTMFTWTVPAPAQAIDVSPVKMELARGERATTLRITNRGTSATALQVRAFAWEQASGQDDLTTTKDVLVSPPVMKVPAGATQLVRIVLRRPPEDKEAAYRLILDQLPSEHGGSGVNVLLQISMPLFVRSAIQAAKGRGVEARLTGGRKPRLHLYNTGPTALEYSNLRLKAGDEVIPVEGGRHLYVLAGAQRQVEVGHVLPELKPGAAISLISGSGSEEVATAVVQPE